MIDLHCHILPGIDDGASDLRTALAMARMALADGITTTACTPHILPGVYDNSGPQIESATNALSSELAEAGIPLRLVSGADIHITPGLVPGLRSGRLPTLNGSRYFLLEPPRHVPPPRIADFVFSVLTAGYIPIVTHPERLSWIGSHYRLVKQLAQSGAWIQLTAGSLLGRFGKRAQHWSERMLSDGLVQILASDAHDVDGRRPVLRDARDWVAQRFGEHEADLLVITRPHSVIENAAEVTKAGPVGRGSQPVRTHCDVL